MRQKGAWPRAGGSVGRQVWIDGQAERCDVDLPEAAALVAGRRPNGRNSVRIVQGDHEMSVRAVSSVGGDVVGVGARVQVHSDDEDMMYTIVEPADANAGAGRVSSESPVGRALLGRVVGELVAVHAPGGRRRLRVMAIDSAGSEVAD
jgi:transcription elongation factor GreA